MRTLKADLLELLRQFAEVEPTYASDYGDDYCIYCAYVNDKHSTDCPWRKTVEMFGESADRAPTPVVPNPEGRIFSQLWEPQMVRSLEAAPTFQVKVTNGD